MSEREIRIGDAEREHALELLGTHLGEGRLSVDEFGERSARVATAKTRGELLALFEDLPAPRPQFTRVAPLPSPAPPARSRLHPRLTGAIVPAVALACVALFFAVRNPVVFLLIPVVMLLVSRMGRQ